MVPTVTVARFRGAKTRAGVCRPREPSYRTPKSSVRCHAVPGSMHVSHPPHVQQGRWARRASSSWRVGCHASHTVTPSRPRLCASSVSERWRTHPGSPGGVRPRRLSPPNPLRWRALSSAQTPQPQRDNAHRCTRGCYTSPCSSQAPAHAQPLERGGGGCGERGLAAARTHVRAVFWGSRST